MRLIEEEDRKGPFGGLAMAMEKLSGESDAMWLAAGWLARLGLGPPVRFATATVSVTVQIRSLE
jgi:hypothetical protein